MNYEIKTDKKAIDKENTAVESDASKREKRKTTMELQQEVNNTADYKMEKRQQYTDYQ